MKMKKRIANCLLILNEFIVFVRHGVSPFFFIPGIFNKYPIIEKYLPFKRSFYGKFDSSLPNHFQRIKNEFNQFGKADLFDCFISFFFLKEYIPGSGWKVIDVGAFKGFYSQLCSKLVGSGGKVIAIEPNDKLNRLLRKNDEANSLNNVIILNNAVSSENGCVLLNVSNEFPSTSSIFLNHTSRFDKEFEKISVPCKTIDKIISDLEYREVELIKIDVEGAEKDVLIGATNSLKNKSIKRLIIEVHRDVIDVDSIIGILKRNNYMIDAVIKTSGERSFLYSRCLGQ